MKTIFTLCLTAVMSLICHNLSAQNSAASFTSPTTPANVQSAKVSSFTSSINNEKILLNWTVGENQEANQFEVERSTDGKTFVMAALVFGTDKTDTDNYMFYEKAKNLKTYYRVKIISKNGSADYSQVIIASSENTTTK